MCHNDDTMPHRVFPLSTVSPPPPLWRSLPRAVDTPLKILPPVQPSDVSMVVLVRMSATLFGRDGGMYDNVPWDWSGDDLAKREAFQRYSALY